MTRHTVNVEVGVHPDDFGKLLGRKGMYANSIRRLWSGAYGREGRNFSLHIIDPKRSHRRS